MYLKKLHITNFRCFRDYTIEFAPGVTVLFGKNGSGKSTLIHAIHKALSFAFRKADEEDMDAISLSAGFYDQTPNGLKPRNYDKKTDIVRDEKTGLPPQSINIYAEARFLDLDLDWNMFAVRFKLYDSKFKYAFQKLMDKIKSTNTFPVFAYFSDSFPHVTNNASNLTKTQLSLRNLGYVGWDDETAYSDLWITKYSQVWMQWNRANFEVAHEENSLKNCDVFLKDGIVTEKEYQEDVALHKARLSNALEERAKYEPEVSAIRDCLVRFTKDDANIEILDMFVSIYDEDGLCLSTRDRKTISFEKLPAGYKRILYMALDIAYRSYILNGTTDSEGVVIIDEIDLHLHPELEQTVLQRFTKTFPKVQFIVSTHSPLVLTGVETEGKPNVILGMSANESEPTKTHDIYGIDYNSGIEDVMGVASKNVELDYMVGLCAYMTKRGKTAQAENIMQRILDEFAKNRDEVEKMVEAKMTEL